MSEPFAAGDRVTGPDGPGFVEYVYDDGSEIVVVQLDGVKLLHGYDFEDVRRLP